MNDHIAAVATLVSNETYLDWDDLLLRVALAREKKAMDTGQDARELSESVEKLLLCKDAHMPKSFIDEFVNLATQCRGKVLLCRTKKVSSIRFPNLATPASGTP